MYIGYNEEQEALRQELRDYYDELLTPEVQEALHHGHGVGPAMREVVEQMGDDGWLGHRLAQGVRRPGPRPDRAVHLLRRVDAGRRAGADAHDQHRRPDDHELRHRRAEGVLPARRSSPARSTSASATPSRAPAPTWPSLQTRAVARRRRVRHQRPEDVDLPRQRRRLLLAGRAHRPRGQEAQGHLDDHRARWTRRASPSQPLQLLASTTSTPTYFDDVRVPAEQPGRRREQRLVAHHQPAQPRAGHALLSRA